MKKQLEDFLSTKYSEFFIKEDDTKTNIPTFLIKAEGIRNVIQGLKEEKTLSYNFLNDLTAVDWLGKKTPRFQVCYLLKSIANNHSRVMLKVPVEDGDSVPSIVSIYKGANWPEREVYDLFGISFIGHPRMDRLIMPDNFLGHPLRKDFPLEGYGQDYLIGDLLEMHTDDMEGT